MTKYLTQDLLRKLNNKAIKYKYNRSIQPSFIQEIPEAMRMPITFTMPHNDMEMRIKFVVANPYEPTSVHFDDEGEPLDPGDASKEAEKPAESEPVSYTHLTLPTNREV